MQPFETAFLLSTCLFLFFICWGKNQAYSRWAIIIGVVLLVFHVVFETERWQMGLAYLLFFLLILIAQKRSRSHLIMRVLGLGIGLLLLGASAFYAYFMPLFDWPEPTGKYLVGTTNFTLVDSSRPELHTSDSQDLRELFVIAWYPAQVPQDNNLPQASNLWQELHRGKLDMVSFLTGYLQGIATNSYPNLPVQDNDGPYPLLLFNHALQMFPEQNTSMMEQLASCGYIVVSIAHPYECLRVNLSTGVALAPFVTSLENFKQGIEWTKNASKPIEQAKILMASTEDPRERAIIMQTALRHSDMNSVVGDWVKDNRFVLDKLVSGYAAKNLFPFMDTTKIGVMGMSLGGAVATELSKADQRIKAAVNIDGLQYGLRNRIPLKVPFLMIYSQDGHGSNDFLRYNSQNSFYQYTLAEAKHADFTDMTLLWPVLRVYGQLGSIPGERMLQVTNDLVLNFWDHYLKGKPYLKFDKQDYPEITGSSPVKTP